MERNRFMQKAIDLANDNVLRNDGEPFGAVVVKDGAIIGMGVNDVSATNDPTAHAEIQAIREACQKLGRADLSDCEIYASGCPCPMCLSAIYWSRIPMVYYSYTLQEAADVGLGYSGHIYEQVALPLGKQSISIRHLSGDGSNKGHPFVMWHRKQAGD